MGSMELGVALQVSAASPTSPARERGVLLPFRNAHLPSPSPSPSYIFSSYRSSCFLRREMLLCDPPLSSRNMFRSSVLTSKTRSPLPLEGSGIRGRRSSDRDMMDDEEEELSSSSFLSLSEKPDRSLALLDEYELEELDSDGPPCPPNHRSGYIAVVGKPNVGKSTLSNQMIGQKLSIVTEKPQTTRHRILGICSGPEYQMILYDTPGVIEKKMHMLDNMMMKNVKSAAINADCVLVVVDATKMPEKLDDVLEEGVGALKEDIPVLLVINKKDLIKPGEIAKRLEWYQKFTEADDVIPVSAKYGQGVDDVKDWILSKLPFGPAYYPKDIASEHPERFFVSEIVREKIFIQYRNEVPYACQVNVLNYISRPESKDFIQVEIVVEKNSQKIILIGKEGKALKVLATAARLDIEDFLQKKVFLEVEVKVKENWRQNEGLLKHYGYGGQIRA